MVKIGGYLRLLRLVNCSMMGFAVIVGAVLAKQNLDLLGGSWLDLFFGFLTGFMLTGASMAINDYYDREIDIINEPERPIPSGAVKPREAVFFAFLLTVIGFFTAYLTNLSCFAMAVFSSIASSTYVTVGKRTGLPGNLLVSLCVAIPFLYGSMAATNLIVSNVLVFTFMAFLSNTGREITKGIVDVEGDRARGVRTLAVRYGSKKAAISVALFYLSAVLLTPIPWILGLVSFWFIPLVAVTDFGLALSSFRLLRDHSKENARKIKNTVLLWFVIGLLAFVADVLLR